MRDHNHNLVSYCIKNVNIKPTSPPTDAEPVLRILPIEIVRIRRHDIFRVTQEEVANHVAALVPSFVDTHRGVHFGPIPGR